MSLRRRDDSLHERPVARMLICAAVLAWLPAGFADGGEPEKPEKGGPEPTEPKDVKVPEEITHFATSYWLDRERNAFIFSGSAWIRFRAAKLEADSIVYFRDKSALYAEGHVRLTEGENQTACDVFYYEMKANRGYAVNATVANVSRPSGAASAANGGGGNGGVQAPRRFRDPYGIYIDPQDDPQARSILIMRAERITQLGPLRFQARNATITNDDRQRPGARIRVDSMDYFLRETSDPHDPGASRRELERTIMRGITVFAGPVPVLWFPGFTFDVDWPSIFLSGSAGSSNRWGLFTILRVGLDLPPRPRWWFQPKRLYVDLDYRDKRGAGGGFELDYDIRDTGSGQAAAHVLDEDLISEEDDRRRGERDLRRRLAPLLDGRPRRSFDPNLLFEQRRALDNAGPPSLFPKRYGGELREDVDFQHHQTFGDLARLPGWNLDLKYAQQSDRDFRHEYREREYKTSELPEALVSLRKAADDWEAEGAYRSNPNDFEPGPPRSIFRGTFTEYAPEGRFDLMPSHLGHGFYLAGAVSAAEVRKTFDRDLIDQDDLESTRLHMDLEFSRPLKAGPVTVKPFLGSAQTFYTDSRDGSTVQAVPIFGATASMRTYGTFNQASIPAIDVHGLRHVVEPRIEYRSVGGTAEKSESLYDFDEVEDTAEVSAVSFILDQRLLTRREDAFGHSRIADMASLVLSLDYYPERHDQRRLLDGGSLDALRVDGSWRILRYLRLDLGAHYNTEDGRLERARWGLRVEPGGRWKFGFSQHYNYTDDRRGIGGSNQFHGYIAYQLSERWRVEFEQGVQTKDTPLVREGTESRRITIVRDFGFFDAELRLQTDRGENVRSVFVNVLPHVASRNLVLPTDRLLAPQAEVGQGGIMGEEGSFGLIPFGGPKTVRKARESKPPKGPLKYPPPAPGAIVPEVPPPPPAEDMNSLPGEE